MPQRVALPLNRPLLVLLAMLALAAGLFLALAPHGKSSAGPTADCANPSLAANATGGLDPASGIVGSALTVNLNSTGFGPSAGGAEPVEAYLNADPPGFFPPENIIGEGTIPAGGTAAQIDGNVPNLAPAAYSVYLCWRYQSPAGGPASWWYMEPGRFTVTGTATPSPTPTPTISPSPTRSPTASPTPTPTASPTATPTPTPTPTLPPSPTPPPPTPTPIFPVFKYFPYAPNPPFDYMAPFVLFDDFSFHGIEMTEGMQCYDTSKGLGGCLDNSLPLVAQKHATARIYLKFTGNGTVKQGIPVRLHLFANNVEYIINTSGAARKTLNQLFDDNPNVWFNANFANGVTVSYYAEVDPDNVYFEGNEGNNRFPASGTLSVTFNKRRTFDVMGWRMRYHPSGFGGNQYAGGWAVNSGGTEWLEDVWPVKQDGIDYSLHSGYMDWTDPILTGQSYKVINAINGALILEWIFPWIDPQLLGQERIHVWTPRDHFVRGLSDPPWAPGLGIASVGDDSPGSSMTMDDPGFGAINFVHEVSHNTGMYHTAIGTGCDTSGGGFDWPYSTAKIQEFGYNPDTGKVYDPASTYDFMSYCYGSGYTTWISPFHWLQQFNIEGSIGSRVKPQSTNDDVLAIAATLDNPDIGGDEGGALGTLHKTDGGGNLIAPPPGDEYSIELRDGQTVLASQTFGVSFEPPDGVDIVGGGPPPEPIPDNAVAFSMPWEDGTTTVALLRGGELLDSVEVSANAPTVEVTDPAQPEVWAAGATETVSWTGADTDGDSLTYTVYYSKDGGDTYELLATGLTGASYNVDVDSIAGGDAANFRVVASDGVNTGFGDSANVSVPNKPPFAAITSPGDGALFPSGGLVLLNGGGADLEDGPLGDDAITWSSDIDGELGAGASLPVNTLSPGTHTITLTATDSDLAEATASITVIIGVHARVAVVPGAVDPNTDDNVLVVVTLDPGTPTEDINEGTLRVKIGASDLDPLSSHQLGDTNQDGLPELLLVLDGAAVRDAVPEPGLLTEALLTGEMADGGALQGVGQLALVLPGDLNCDGMRDGQDVFDGLAFVASLAAPDCTFAADFDCSGDLTTGDLLGLLGRIAGTAVVSIGCPEEPAPAAVSAAGPDDGARGGIARILTWSWPALLLVLPALVAVKPRRKD